jgi:hypothetical protein
MTVHAIPSSSHVISLIRRLWCVIACWRSMGFIVGRFTLLIRRAEADNDRPTRGGVGWAAVRGAFRTGPMGGVAVIGEGAA